MKSLDGSTGSWPGLPTGVTIHSKPRMEKMSDQPAYTPPKVWTWDKENGGAFANINRPIAGPTHEKELPVGRHPLQLYSLATPNGVKVTVMLEELLALGHAGAEYDAWLIKINEGDQFGSGFVQREPQLEDPGAHGPERRRAGSRVRVGRDPPLPRGEVRRVPAQGPRGAHRVLVVALLADGRRRRTSAAASAISMRMRRRRSNTRSTGSRWR